MTTTSPDLPRPTGGAFPPMPKMSHTITVRPRKRRLGGEQRRALRSLSRDDTSRRNREVHIRICERLGVKFPGPTRQNPTFSARRKRSAQTSTARPAGTKPCPMGITSITSLTDGWSIPMVLIATTMGRYSWPDLRLRPCL